MLDAEMGLEKTLQVTALIAALVTAAQALKELKAGRYFIIEPLSVLPNWMEQFETFMFTISIVVYIGPLRDREATQEIIKGSAMD